ncbi:class III lanthionine synthetase LanKC [Luethyella okanaganae]|uniref:Class III lanthionine synthetase LanKC n=1 Tax=Luethyella okanaganae TaxID=69372 RepID=A0ABW1VEJ6_9MICO
MDLRYLEFALVDQEFYDQPSERTPNRRRFNLALDLDWSAWETTVTDGWVRRNPLRATLPDQGWKIHASATTSNAQELLTTISTYCHARSMIFKHVPSHTEMLQRNMKYVDRATSGKFVTIYPQDEDELLSTLAELDALLDGAEGPYILSDLRWNEGPLYVRYGGFRMLYTRNEHDIQVPAVRHPDGRLVPDERLPSFSPPAWVTLPSFLKEQIEKLGSGAAPEGFDYQISEALHFSNGGGVYRATQISTGREVILKEGRPHAGLTPDGRDAVARLDSEAAILEELRDEPSIVDLIDKFTLFGHRFMACEFIDGETLNKEMVLRNPIIRSDSSRADRDEYRKWVLSICDQVEEQLQRLHARGIVFGDLHPNNLMVKPDGRVTFVDLEMSHHEIDDSLIAIGAPGYVASDGRRGFAADKYSLACIKLSLFIPLTVLFNLDPRKLDDHLAAAQAEYELSGAFIESIRLDMNLPTGGRSGSSRLSTKTLDSITAWDTSTVSGIRHLQELIVRFIESSADFSRYDRSYPGDIRQFTENGFGLAHGAAGVVHALRVSGFNADPLALQWIADAVTEYRGQQIGLYDGIAGVAWLWRELGMTTSADEITDKLLNVDFDNLTSDLYSGLAGIGLFLLSERDHLRDYDRVDAALADIFEILARRSQALPDPTASGPQPSVPTGRGGLFWGQSGVSLFASRLYQATSDERHLQLAQFTLDYDLAHCVEVDDGSIQMNEGWRVLPYLASGSIGCGLALLQFLDVGGPREYVNMLATIERVTMTDFVVEPNVSNGRSGLLLFIADLERHGLATSSTSTSFDWHLSQLKLHALQNKVGIAFPGEQMIRLSTDVSTGAAGVLLTLDAARRRLGGDAFSRGDLLPLIISGNLAPVSSTSQISESQISGEEVSSYGLRTRVADSPEPHQRSRTVELGE